MWNDQAKLIIDLIKEQWKKTDEKFVLMNWLIVEQWKRFDEKFVSMNELIDEKFKWVDEKFKWIDEKFKWIDEKFKSMDEKIKSMDEKIEIKLDSINEKIQWLHEDNARLEMTDKIVIEENRKIRSDFLDPIQRLIAVKKVEFTSVWWFVSFLIALTASLMTFWIAKAV